MQNDSNARSPLAQTVYPGHIPQRNRSTWTDPLWSMTSVVSSAGDLWSISDPVQYFSKSQQQWIATTVTRINEDGTVDTAAKKKISPADLKGCRVGVTPPEKGFDETTGLHLDGKTSGADGVSAYIRKVENRFHELVSRHHVPHIAFLSKLLEVNISKTDSSNYSDGASQLEMLAACGIDQQRARKALEQLVVKLVHTFPKKTLCGDRHSYVQFTQNPPTGRSGAIHIAQFAPWIEPLMGSDWNPILALLADALAGKPIEDKLKVAAITPGPLSLSPSIAGWQGDGEPSNAIKLMTLYGMALSIIDVEDPMPPALTSWARQFSVVIVGHTRHATPSAKLLSNWTDTVTAHAIAKRLTPIRMAKSLLISGLQGSSAVASVGRSFESSLVAQKIGIKGKIVPRMQTLVNREKIPQKLWALLVEHYDSAPTEDAVAFSDRIFDLPGFGIGNVAVQTFKPFLRRIFTVTRQSLNFSLTLAINTRAKKLPRVTEEQFTFYSAAFAMWAFITDHLVQKGCVTGSIALSYGERAASNGSDIVLTSVKTFIEQLPDCDPADITEWAAQFIWVQNAMADSKERAQAGQGLEHKRMEREGQELRVDAALRTIMSEVEDVVSSVAVASELKGGLQQKLDIHERRRATVGAEALKQAEFALQFKAISVKIAQLGTAGLEEAKNYINDVSLCLGVQKRDLAVVTCIDMGLVVLSNTLLHNLRGFLSGVDGSTPHFIFYPEFARGRFKYHGEKQANPQPTDSQGSEPDQVDEEDEQEDQELADLDLPESKARRTAHRRTASQEVASLARDVSEVNTQIVYNNVDTFAPVPFALKLSDGSARVRVAKGMALMPVCASHSEVWWYEKMDAWTLGLYEGVLAENVVKCGRAAAMKAAVQPPNGGVDLHPRRSASVKERLQRGPSAFRPLLEDWRSAAKAAEKKALVVIQPFAGIQDLSFEAYEHHVASWREHGVAPDMPTFVLSIVSDASTMEVGQGRFKHKAYADFSAGTLRIAGHQALASRPVSLSEDEDPIEKTVSELRARLKFCLIEVVEGEPKVRVPSEDSLKRLLSVVDMTESHAKKLAELIEKHGEPTTGAPAIPQSLGAGEPVPVPAAQEYFNLAAAQSEWDIVATLPQPNYIIHIMCPKYTPPEHLRKYAELFVENHSANSRVELPKMTFILRFGVGTFLPKAPCAPSGWWILQEWQN